MAVNPLLAKVWLTEDGGNPVFPKFDSNPTGGITAWFTMRLTALGEDQDHTFELDLPTAIRLYEERDTKRCARWLEKFTLLKKQL